MKVMPVIHLESIEQALKNASLAQAAGAYGVFVISMEGSDELVLPAACQIKDRFPSLFVGVNLLRLPADEAVSQSQRAGLDGTWCDNGGISSRGTSRIGIALGEKAVQKVSHKVFVGVAFKYQEPERDPPAAARVAQQMGLIPTTSGEATGVAANVSKVTEMRSALRDGPLALASGLTPENVSQYSGLITHALVATGISRDFHNLDPERLNALIERA